MMQKKKEKVIRQMENGIIHKTNYSQQQQQQKQKSRKDKVVATKCSFDETQTHCYEPKQQKKE